MKIACFTAVIDADIKAGKLSGKNLAVDNLVIAYIGRAIAYAPAQADEAFAAFRDLGGESPELMAASRRPGGWVLETVGGV